MKLVNDLANRVSLYMLHASAFMLVVPAALITFMLGFPAISSVLAVVVVVLEALIIRLQFKIISTIKEIKESTGKTNIPLLTT